MHPPTSPPATPDHRTMWPGKGDFASTLQRLSHEKASAEAPISLAGIQQRDTWAGSATPPSVTATLSARRPTHACRSTPPRHALRLTRPPRSPRCSAEPRARAHHPPLGVTPPPPRRSALPPNVPTVGQSRRAVALSACRGSSVTRCHRVAAPPRSLPDAPAALSVRRARHSN